MVALVTNAGLAGIVAAWAAAAPIYLQYGTGSGQSETDNVLAAPLQSRVAGAASIVTTDVADDTLRVTGTISSSAAAGAITEVGLFEASSGGDMDVYGDFDAINLAVGDEITFQVNITVS